MAEEVVAGSVVRRFTYGREPLSQTQLVNSAWVTHWYGYDEPGTGSVRLLTDAAGVVTDTYDYDAYGNQVASTGTTANPRRYRGEWWDEGAGLLYLRARWYNPATGRFLTADQWEPEVPKPCCAVSGGYGPAHHLYGYTDADPVNYIDPSGRFTERSILSTGSLEAILPATNTAKYARCISGILLSLLRASAGKFDLFGGFTQIGLGNTVWGCGAAFGLWP